MSDPSSEVEVTESPVVGVLALQGAFAKHLSVLAGLGVTGQAVRTPAQLELCDALVIPGGESTTISKLLVSNELFDPLAARLAAGMPAMGTCAGMIMLASEVLDGRPDQRSFAAIELTVQRNGYGRQVDSFEADLAVVGIADPPVRAVFIRAPVVAEIGTQVEVLAEVDGAPVICRQGPILVTSFHPELTDDDRLHRLFVDSVIGS